MNSLPTPDSSRRKIHTYIVTGVTREGKRFSDTYHNYFHAMMINLWCGSVWEVKEGKRKLLKRVYN